MISENFLKSFNNHQLQFKKLDDESSHTFTSFSFYDRILEKDLYFYCMEFNDKAILNLEKRHLSREAEKLRGSQVLHMMKDKLKEELKNNQKYRVKIAVGNFVVELGSNVLDEKEEVCDTYKSLFRKHMDGMPYVFIFILTFFFIGLFFIGTKFIIEGYFPLSRITWLKILALPFIFSFQFPFLYFSTLFVSFMRELYLEKKQVNLLLRGKIGKKE